MSDVYSLLSPDESKDYIRVKQATKQGYILCEKSENKISSSCRAFKAENRELYKKGVLK